MGGANVMAMKRPLTMGFVAVLVLALAVLGLRSRAFRRPSPRPLPVLPSPPPNYADDPVGGVVTSPNVGIQIQFTDPLYPIYLVGPTPPRCRSTASLSLQL